MSIKFFLEVTMKKSALALALMMQLHPPLLAADATEGSPSAPEMKASGENRETVCKNGDMVRRVKVGANEGAACQVSYMKETEEPGGTEKVLWNAKQEASYCQDKADGFIEKLKGMGWTCS